MKLEYSDTNNSVRFSVLSRRTPIFDGMKFSPRFLVSRLLLQVVAVLAFSAGYAQSSAPYFQQEVHYKIKVRLDDSLHMLYGEESFTYTNHSPDTLHFIYIHLWPNGYKNNQTALAKQLVRNNNAKLQFASEEQRGWIDSLNFTDTQGALNWQYDPEHQDICKVILREPLLPGASTQILTPFVVKIPGDFSRLGHRGKSYQISQWYPKPAVYDKEGWHPMPYLDLGEFYSEYGSFDVQITLPATYRVAATGVLQEKEELAWLTALSATTPFQYPAKDSVITLDKDRIGKQKTISFKQDRIHDFAFFCAQNFIVRKDTAVLRSGKTVEAWAFFEPKKETHWEKGAFYVKRAVEAYSEWVGDYPYAAATAVQGALSAGGGMEYPMVTVISAGSTAEQLDNIITHEVGHNWFYGILGSNEREHAWMDEGFNSYIEERYMRRYYPERTFGAAIGLPDKLSANRSSHWFSYLSATIHSSYGYQYAINTPSIELPTLQYGLLSYQRTAFLLNYLAEYLGQEQFDLCMHQYFSIWQFKHPQPEDVQNAFEMACGKKLDWFFDDLFNTERQFDYALTRIIKEEHKLTLIVKNKGQIAAPFPVYMIKGDSVVRTLWVEGHLGTKSVGLPQIDCDYIMVDKTYLSPDLRLANNRIRTKGLFREVAPLNVKMSPGFLENDKSTLRIHPSIGYNTSDGFMAGVVLHNMDIQGKPLAFLIMPMYGFGSETMAGNALLRYDWLVHDKALKKVRLMGQYKRFAGYDKLEPSLNFFFHTGRLQHKKHWLSVSNAWITHRGAEARFMSEYTSSRIRYQRTKKNALLKENLSAGISVIRGNEVTRQMRLEITYQRNDRLAKKSKLVSRVYAGYLGNSSNPNFDLYSAGSPDINKDYYLIDRIGNKSAGWFGSNQVLIDQGGFMSFNMRAQTFLASANLEYRYSWFFHPYVHGLVLDEFLYYETGLGLSLGVLDVYFPISSNAFVDGVPANGTAWAESIRFTLNYNLGSLFNTIELQF